MGKGQKMPPAASLAAKPKGTDSVTDTLRADFEETRAQREAIATPSRTPFDLTNAYVVVSGALPTLRAIEPQLRAALPLFDVTALQRVDRYARAALYAQSVERSTTNTSAAHHAKLVEELESLYARFYRNAEFLAAEGLFDAKVVANARSGTSVRDRAADLRLLAIEFAEREASLVGRTLVTRANMEHAFSVSQSVLDSLASRDNLNEAQVKAQRDRQLAAALLYQTWNEIRRAIAWLRWNEGDADKFAPSFFTSAGRRSSDHRRDSEPTDPEPTDPDPDPSRG